MGDDQMNPIEGETNTQEGNIPVEDNTVLTAETDIQEGISAEEIDKATVVLKEENESLVDMDRTKGLIKSEVNLLKFKAYELAKGIKDITLSKVGKIASTTALAFVLTSCASSPKVVMAVPQEMTERAEQRQTQTQEAFVPTPTSEATLSPEEIREKRLNEIAEVVKENDYRFTVEELDVYRARNGQNNSVSDSRDKWKGSGDPFQYYFVNNEDIGYLIYPAPYSKTQDMTLNDYTQNDIIGMINEREVSEIVESVYHDLYLNTTDDKLGWENEPGKYTVVFYMMRGIDEDGKPYDIMIPNIGIYSFKDVEGEIKSVLWEKAANKNLTDEEIAFFTDEVLESLRNQEGWIMFAFDKNGNLEKKESNAKDFYNLLHPAISSDTVAQEIN